MTPRLLGLGTFAQQCLARAGTALDAGRLDAAVRELAQLPGADAGHPEALRLRAGVESLRGQHQQAIALMRDAVAQRPDDALYRNTLGTILGNAGDMDAAVDALRQACTLRPDLALAWFNLGVMLLRDVRNDEAEAALGKAVALAPDLLAARTQLADILRTRGDADGAAAEYRRVIARQPWAGLAWGGLADLKTLRFGGGDIDAMRAALRAPQASDDDRMAIGFALARALDDAGRYAEALDALADAHAIGRRRQRWDAAGYAAGIDAILAAFDPPPAGAADPTLGREAIFIVSLPRSGSTLVEQILASHSAVEGSGELPDVPLVLAEESRRRGVPFPRWVKDAAPADWERLGRRYLERTARWRRRRPLFTDKLPNNWSYLGAIRAMLPGARVVVVRRDPLETCFSSYRQRLVNGEYARSFDDLAAFWRTFDHAVERWQELYPGRIHEHRHEALQAAPEATIRALLAACGLPFEEACMHFERTRRDVSSPSATQVREPLHRDALRARRYGALLDPLRAALGYPPAAADAAAHAG